MMMSASVQSIPIRNVWYLLLYAWDQTRWKGMDLGGQEMGPGLTGLMARVLVQSTDALMRHGLRHEFRRRSDHLNGIRGRIDFGATLKRRGFTRGEITCVFPELTVDTLPNRIVRATAQRLVVNPNLAAGANAKVAEDLQHSLRALCRKMPGVSEIEVRPELFSRVALTRNESGYTLPLLVCELLAKHSIPSSGGTDRLVMSLLAAETDFAALFEGFVRNFYRHHLVGKVVRTEHLHWPMAVPSEYMPMMRTDTTIESADEGGERIVIETKYYPSVFVAGRFDSQKYRSEHLFQLYAYLRTQEERGATFRSAKGILLYPSTSGDVRERVEIQGHQVTVASVDLARPWQAIEARLLELVANA